MLEVVTHQNGLVYDLVAAKDAAFVALTGSDFRAKMQKAASHTVSS
jgi:hypothetical protein